MKKILIVFIITIAFLFLPVKKPCACVSYMADIKTGKVIMVGGEASQPLWERIYFRLVYGDIDEIADRRNP